MANRGDEIEFLFLFESGTSLTQAVERIEKIQGFSVKRIAETDFTFHQYLQTTVVADLREKQDFIEELYDAIKSGVTSAGMTVPTKPAQ